MSRRDTCRKCWRSRRRYSFGLPVGRFGSPDLRWILRLSREVDFLLDAADAKFVTRIPLRLAVALRHPVFRVFPPMADGFKTVPVGNGDAKPVSAACAFNSQEAWLLG